MEKKNLVQSLKTLFEDGIWVKVHDLVNIQDCSNHDLQVYGGATISGQRFMDNY